MYSNADGIFLVDETLRDGLQWPHAHRLRLYERLAFIQCCIELGIPIATVGYPAASEIEARIVSSLVSHSYSDHIEFACSACASSESQVTALLRSTQSSRTPVRAMMYESTWDKYLLRRGLSIDALIDMVSKQIARVHDAGLNITFVFEHGTKCDIETIVQASKVIVPVGVERLCIADTAGSCDAQTAHSYISNIRRYLCDTFPKRSVGIEWHGHEDLHLGVACAVAAYAAGASYLHCCALGIGERVGNVATEGIVCNLLATGHIKKTSLHPEKLASYSNTCAELFGTTVPYNLPGVSQYAFSTAAGRHARAQISSNKNCLDAYDSTFYAPFDPSTLNRKSRILIGPYSGRSNIEAVLKKRIDNPSELMISAVYAAAKRGDRVMTHDDVFSAAGETDCATVSWSKRQPASADDIHVCIVASSSAGTLGHVTSARGLIRMLRHGVDNNLHLTLITDDTLLTYFESAEIDNLVGLRTPSVHIGSKAGASRYDLRSVFIALHNQLKPHIYIFDTFFCGEFVDWLVSHRIRRILVSYQLRDTMQSLFRSAGWHEKFNLMIWFAESSDLYTGQYYQSIAKNQVMVPPPVSRPIPVGQIDAASHGKILALCGGGGRPGAKELVRHICDIAEELQDFVFSVVSGPFNPSQPNILRHAPVDWTMYDEPERLRSKMARADLIISESGYHASLEICCLGRRAIFIPGYRKLDNQERRAVLLGDRPGIRVVLPEDMCRELTPYAILTAMSDPSTIEPPDPWPLEQWYQIIVSQLDELK